MNHCKLTTKKTTEKKSFEKRLQYDLILKAFHTNRNIKKR